MKNSLRILAVVLAIITLSLVAFAADNANAEPWKQIFTASDLVEAYKAGQLVPKNLSVSETYDDTGYYLRAKADAKQSSTLCFTLPEPMQASKITAVIVGYRTTYPTVPSGTSRLIGIDFPKDNTFNWQNRYLAREYDRTQMDNKDGYVSGVAVFTDIKDKLINAGATEIQYFKLNPWNGQTLVLEDETLLDQMYADIEYIGFFEDYSEATKFNYDVYSEGALDVTVYNITYLGKDGETIATEKALEGMTCAPMTAPVIEYHDFTGWVFEDGSKVPATFEATKDVTLKATYRYNEKAYLSDIRKDVIAEALKKGLERTDKPFISGYDGFEFRPENNMTRAEACTVVARLVVVDEKTLDNSMTTAFTDLSKDAWYYKYVTYLESIGYLKSYTGEFKPDQKITRAEFVELVYNMGKISGGDKVVSFKDVPADHPRYDVIMAAAKAGLVNGKTADTFDPDGDIKRSEVVKVLCIALGRNPDKNSFTEVIVAGFTDINATHWAYPYVMAAAYEHKSIVGKDGEEIWTSVNDTNNYMVKASDELINNLNKKFDERVEKILNSKSEWTVAPGGTVWYFSNSEGENINDGKSPATPMKSISKLERMMTGNELKPGDVVLFKRGDEWHDNITCTIDGITFSAYGEGPKPRILASIEADKPTQWKETDVPGVYVYQYAVESKKDVGQIVFNDGEAYAFRIIPDPKTGNILKSGDENLVGNGIKTWINKEMKFEGYKTLAEYAAQIPDSDLFFYHDYEAKKVYLYSRTGNPGDRFDSIEMATHGHNIAVKANNVTIDNLCLKFTGSHGVGAGTCEQLTVRNCEVGWIGGSIQNPAGTDTTRFGNAIEIFGGADGFYVYDCYIYQCFDCGPTVQWQGSLAAGQTMVEKDIAFYGNALCEASLEVWLTTSKPATADSYALLENCRMYDNYITGSGTGWKAFNHQKYEWCSFYGGGQTNAIYRDCYMEGNYFWGNRRHIMKATPTTTKDDLGFKWINNTIIHPKDEGSIGFLGNDSINAKGPNAQYFYNEKTINELVKNGTFGLNKFYYTPGNKANARRITDGTANIYKD